MSDPSAEIQNLLDIERLEVDLFRGIGSGGETEIRIFGGHVIAQALMAAYLTVPDRTCHSLHAYFIRPGDPKIPVIYEVDRARDGGSFTTRRVIAIQHGKQILNLSASFHEPEEGWEYQHKMPDVPAPDGLPSMAELRAKDAEKLDTKQAKFFARPRPIEVREVNPQNMLEPTPMDDENCMWFRMPAAEGHDAKLQHCYLAYASDMNLLGSSLRPHGLSWLKGGVVPASLDHAMWFHAPIHFDQWHLYAMDAPFTGGGRGFNRGKIFDQNGKLVASVAQEGLVRRYKPAEARK